MYDAAASPGVQRRLRLCVLIPSHWTAVMGGSEYQVQVLMDHLTRRPEIDVHFVTNRIAAGVEPRGYEVHLISREFGIRRYGHFFDAVPLYRLLRRLRPDVIYQVIGSAHTGIASRSTADAFFIAWSCETPGNRFRCCGEPRTMIVPPRSLHILASSAKYALVR